VRPGRRSYWPFPCPLFVGDNGERPMERDRETKRDRGREKISIKYFDLCDQ
jgi:hypothetical protein